MSVRSGRVDTLVNAAAKWHRSSNDTLPEAGRDGSLPKKSTETTEVASPLDALLKPHTSPQEQTAVIGRMLVDYWTTTHTLPTGEWSEMVEQLSGKNPKGLTMFSKSHAAIGKIGFRAGSNEPSVVLHVISCRDGIFQLIYCGKDGLAYTDDDLIRNFPADFDGNWNGR